MSLPVINAPEFEAKVPSSGQKIFFRPFLVKEEKALYVAMEGGQQSEMVNTVSKVIQNCITSEKDINVSELAYFDLEYLFLKLRSKSVGEVVDLKFKHVSKPDCPGITPVSVKLDDIEVTFSDDHTDKIMITDEVGIKLKYPTISSVSNIEGQDIDSIFDYVVDSIDYIYDQEKIYEETSKKELKEFIENLSQEQFGKVMNFFNTLPKLTKTITFNCAECGEEETIVVEGLQGFFA